LALDGLAACGQKRIHGGHGFAVSQGESGQRSQRVVRGLANTVALHDGVVEDDGDIVGGDLHVELGAVEALFEGQLHGRDAVFGRAFKLVEAAMGDDARLLGLGDLKSLLGSEAHGDDGQCGEEKEETFHNEHSK